MRYPKCPKCGAKTSKIVSQNTDKVMGFICDSGHYYPTNYGKTLLKGKD